jgi:hypothetical protein
MIPQSIKDLVGTWAGALRDADLGAAVAAAGVLQARPALLDEGTDPAGLSQRLEDYLEQARQTNRVLSWRPPRESLQILDAGSCLEAIRSHGARVEIGLDTTASAIAPDWQTTLLTGLESVHGELGVYTALDAGGKASWRWPLPVGLLRDPASEDLAGRLESYSSWPVLENTVAAEDGDILLLPHDVSAIDSIKVPDGVAPSLVVVLGAIDVPNDQVADYADRWADAFGASGCHLVGGADGTNWMREFLREFSHNYPVDMALAKANQAAAAGPGYTALAERFAADTRLSWMVERFARQLLHAPPIDVEITDPMRNTLYALPSDPVLSAVQVAEFLEDRAHEFRYDQESEEATGVAELMLAFGELPSLATANGGDHRGRRPAETRVINGAIYEDTTRQRTSLVAGTEYELQVWIGQPTEESDTQAGAPPLPTEELPVGPKLLQINFVSPRNYWEEQTTEVELLDEGDTERKAFRVLVDEPGDFFGRIIVSFDQRILQTAAVRARVVAGSPSRIGRPEIHVEMIIRSDLADIPGGGEFDLAMVVNQDDTGDRTASVISKHGVTLRSVDGLQQAKDDLVALLTRVADSPDDYSEITSEESIALLFELATIGESLHQTFVRDHHIEPDFFENGRLQLIAASPDSYLPVELFYAGPPPTDHPAPLLCENFDTASATGHCEVCTADGADERDPMPICPAWFWGIRYVVERHAHDREFTELLGDYMLRNEPTPQRYRLTMLSSVVMAMSGNVLTDDQNELRQAVPRAAVSTDEANSWAELKTKVGALNPSLLLLLPHTEMLGSAFAMEIANDILLRANLIKPPYVSPSGEPIVAALLGCDTAHTEVPFQGLVPRFRRAGASVVISTVNTILGRHAVPVATKLLDLAKALPKDQTIGVGDLLRNLRRTTLRSGYPMVLSVVGFGDADWQILGTGGAE